MAVTKQDYYELLDVPADASTDQVREAFHDAAQRTALDFPDPEELEERCRELAEAYSALSRPTSRLLYDTYGYRSRLTVELGEALDEARMRAVKSAVVTGLGDREVRTAPVGSAYLRHLALALFLAAAGLLIAYVFWLG